MDNSIILYLSLVILVSLQRVWELGLSKRNTHRLKAQGAVEFGSNHYSVMAALHTTWLVACILEAVSADHPPTAILTITGMSLLCVGQLLRIAAIRTLGPRWTTRIIILPQTSPVNHGIFRYVRHPNYLGVILEIVALPLIYGSWLTAIGFSIANGLLLWVRIRTEEKALQKENDYETYFNGRNRFIPTGRSS